MVRPSPLPIIVTMRYAPKFAYIRSLGKNQTDRPSDMLYIKSLCYAFSKCNLLRKFHLKMRVGHQNLIFNGLSTV